MTAPATPRDFDVYTTCPASADNMPGKEYLNAVVDVARWTEEHGCRGALVYTDNTLMDSWAVAQAAIAGTSTFVPLVAVQPVYQHPFVVANTIASLAKMYERQVDVNFVAGGFQGHLTSLGDTLDHDQRYERLREYADIVQSLISQPATTHSGRHYQVTRSRTNLRIAKHLRPRYYVSGSSPASARTADDLQVVQLSYPTPPEEFVVRPTALRGRHGTGVRLGIIARDTAEEAWRDAEQRFPDDDLGRQLHDLAQATVSSVWHHELSARADQRLTHADNYWLRPFRTYKTFCPYLVGSHEEVSAILSSYLADGVRTIILDIPASFDDLGEAMSAISRAAAMANGSDREK
ncbi:LLM class flavin-dependent oxidoreductase [Actinoplanes sp. KI2]|uniref:LLM class flavin-dependent oxidoreductase n=1 Tax=Actinoplanes sp. KI2 TaxID=2983315 RepID=UPI0021D5D0FF|nr:LLM class flavin-dependent oxidoreductase [Actinoplanes sp. KI2]MCU7725972.1 LLM class flavin-dependent oxidoreductase [Actinoplanes sp. KI2]